MNRKLKLYYLSDTPNHFTWFNKKVTLFFALEILHIKVRTSDSDEVAIYQMLFTSSPCGILPICPLIRNAT